MLLLAQGGRTVYMGPPGIAVVYFREGLGFTLPKNDNPADILMDIIGGKKPRDKDPGFRPQLLVREDGIRRKERRNEHGRRGWGQFKGREQPLPPTWPVHACLSVGFPAGSSNLKPSPPVQVDWWAHKGQAWVSEFERCNPLMKDEDLTMDPETLSKIDEAFDE